METVSIIVLFYFMALTISILFAYNIYLRYKLTKMQVELNRTNDIINKSFIGNVTESDVEFIPNYIDETLSNVCESPIKLKDWNLPTGVQF